MEKRKNNCCDSERQSDENCCKPKKRNVLGIILFVVILGVAILLITYKLFIGQQADMDNTQNVNGCISTSQSSCDSSASNETKKSCCPGSGESSVDNKSTCTSKKKENE